MVKIILVSLTLLSFPSFGAFEFYQGVRQMGMGGASIAVVNDETAVLSNPNGLGKLRDYFFTLIDPEITASADGYETLLGTAAINSAVPEDLYNQLSDRQGEPYYFKSQIFPSVVLPNFGIGILGKYEVLGVRNADGTFDYNYLNDYSLNLAYNMRFWGGRIKLGFAGRLLNRISYSGAIDPATESLALSAFAQEGLGLALDTGLTLTAPWDYLPTLTILARDVGTTSFTFGDGLFRNGSNGTPQAVKQSYDVAVALFPIFGRHSRGAFTVEYTNVLDTAGVTEQMDRIHIGTEFNFWDAYFFRAGYHQNDWTAGFEYSTGIFQWQMATYSEEVTIGSMTDRDRRATLKLAVRF